MSTLFSLGLSQPWVLVLLPILGVALLTLYRRRQRGNEVPVGSLMILSRLQNPRRPETKITPPPRFFFELLLLLLFLLGVGRLYHSEDTKRVAVLIDNSLSMAVVNHRSAFPKSLLAAAVDEAIRTIRDIPSGDRVVLFETSPVLRRVTDSEGHSAVVEAFEKVRAVFARDQLQGAVNDLASQGFDRVYVFSDKYGEGVNPSSTVHSQGVFSSISAAEAANIAIAGIRRVSSVSEARREAVEVEIAAYGKAAGSVELIVEPIGWDGKVNGAPRRANVRLETGRSVWSSVELPVQQDGAGWRVSLAGIQSPDRDWLPEDNQGWIPATKRAQKIGVISPFSLEDLGLQRIPGFEFVRCEKEALGGCLAEVHGLIIHREEVPLPLVEGDAAERALALVMPPNSPLYAPYGSGCSEAKPTWWSPSEEILGYLSLAGITFPQCLSFATPAWGARLIDSTQGTVAFQGRLGRVRLLVTGFDLFPFRGKAQPFSSVFLLNLLKWLRNSSADTSEGDDLAAILAGAENAQWLNGSGASTASGEERRAPAPGLYVISAADGTKEVRAFNFFAQDESEPRVRPYSIPESKKGPSGNQKSEDEEGRRLGTSLAWLLIGLLVLDLLVQGLRIFVGRGKE